MNKEKGRLTEVLRFAVTGGVCFAVEFACLVLLRDKMGLDTLAAVPIAFLISVAFNYLLCVLWVFKGAREQGKGARAGFLITSVMGLLLNEGLMYVFRHVFGENQTVLTLFGFAVTMYMVSKALATLIVMVWNYFTKRAILTSKKAKKGMIALLIALVCGALAVAGFAVYGKAQQKKIPGLTFAEALRYTAQGNPDAAITVGIIQNGEAAWTVYGEDGEELPHEARRYEIGSLTKTFTAALVCRAVGEGLISLEDGIDRYLPLPEGKEYPTVKNLLTHTSGYEEHYFSWPMASNFFSGRNSFYGVGKGAVLSRIGQMNMTRDEYGFAYSNFGYAALGLVLEREYGQDWAALANAYAAELGLTKTKVETADDALPNGWDWAETDAYRAAGALTSDIEDMLRYAELLLTDGRLTKCLTPIKAVDAFSADYQAMGIRVDAVGMAWMVDEENGVVWHNGGTGHYNCYLGLKPEEGTAVVVLSNLSPSYRIPATVLGIKALNELGGAEE